MESKDQNSFKQVDQFHQKVKDKINKDEYTYLRERLVAHRGWHRLKLEDNIRPLENTREAIKKAISLNIGFVECDVFQTKDDKVILSHDEAFSNEILKEKIQEKLICDMTLEEIQKCQLIDGQYPVLLETILKDLNQTKTKLALEIIHTFEIIRPSSSKATAKLLFDNQQYLSSIGWVMSFRFEAIEIFYNELLKLGLKQELMPKIVFLTYSGYYINNLQDPDPNDVQLEYQKQTILEVFKSQKDSFIDSFQKMNCGLSIEYNPFLTPKIAKSVKKQLKQISQNGLFHLWHDKIYLSKIDKIQEQVKWLKFFDFVNTDFAKNFL